MLVVLNISLFLCCGRNVFSDGLVCVVIVFWCSCLLRLVLSR